MVEISNPTWRPPGVAFGNFGLWGIFFLHFASDFAPAAQPPGGPGLLARFSTRGAHMDSEYTMCGRAFLLQPCSCGLQSHL